MKYAAAAIVAITLLIAVYTFGIQFDSAGQPAEILLEVPTRVEVGELVTISLGESVADAVKWKLVPESPDFRVLGKEVLFSARTPGNYRLIVAAASGGTVAVQEYPIAAGRAKRKRVSIPKNGFAASVDEWVNGVRSEEVDDEREKLAQSFDLIANLIEQDILKKPGNIVKATSASNKKVLGSSRPKWDPFFARLKAELGSRGRARTLDSAEDHARLWRQIADGLK